MPRSVGRGCTTCRIRRVKCDEARPNCRRCISTGRRCDGYLPVDIALSRRALVDIAKHPGTSIPEHIKLLQQRRQAAVPVVLTRSLSQAPAALARTPTCLGDERSRLSLEFQLFDVFRSRTIPSATLLAPSQFWTQLVLKLTHNEPAMWHACITLASLQQAWHVTENNGASAGERLHTSRQAKIKGVSEVHYYRAISLAKTVSHPTSMLVLSILLGAAAGGLGRTQDARMHVIAGRKLFVEGDQSHETARAADVLVRLDLDRLSVMDMAAPYVREDMAALRHCGQQGLFERGFDTYGQAFEGIYALTRVLMVNHYQSWASFLIKEYKFSEDLRAWELGMARFEIQPHIQTRETRPWAAGTGCENMIYALSIRICHTFLYIMLHRLREPIPETRFDQDLALFERVILLSEELCRRAASDLTSVSIDPGLIMVLYMAGSKCRHSRLRRKCVRMLEKLKRREGVWRSDAAAGMLLKIIEVEEQRHVHFGDVGDNQQFSPPTQTEMRYLQSAMKVSWNAWTKPGFGLQAWETWDRVDVIPEHCRVQDTDVAVFEEDGYLSATLHLAGSRQNQRKVIVRF
ncbi:uncharacterized protein TrAtP1_000030 [Trichoderma atroviride]|uniref:uncharacterized protein n=1 Tax=Hypocrea atroviridis TaxID=63577 RepID=UPI003316D8BB|nr:hypothetical protein TrAtP1_000030 [Trichoderma atroviride]